MTISDLKSAGLDEKESMAYLALLELGEAHMGQLVKKSGLKRTTLYDVMEALKRQGLVSTLKRQKKIVYMAEDPRKILELLDEKRSSIEKILPELLSITNTLEKRPRIRYFEGVDGMKEVYKDTLRYTNQRIQAWVSEDMINHFDAKFMSEYYVPKRVEKRIWAEVIAPDLPTIRGFKEIDQASLRVTKLMDAQLFPILVEISLYGPDRIGIMSFHDRLGLIIESVPIATTLKSIFALQWATLDA